MATIAYAMQDWQWIGLFDWLGKKHEDGWYENCATKLPKII